MKWLSWAGRVGSIELLGGQDLHSGPNADSTFFNDPELALDRFILEPCEDAREYIKEVRLVLASEAKNNEAGEFGGWVSSDVSEAGVERDEDSSLLECSARYPCVGSAAEVLLECC